MAYGEKYRVYADHQFGGDSRYAKIMMDGYSGAVTELTGGLTPITLDCPSSDADIFDPICGTELVLQILSLTDEQFIEFATSKNRQYMAVLYNADDSTNEWRGWLVPDEYEEPYNQPPYDTDLVFSCGLGMLAGVPFLQSTGGYTYTGASESDGDYYEGRARESEILGSCLQKLYSSAIGVSMYVMINLFEDNHTKSISTGPLMQTYVDRWKYMNDDGTVWNCLDVIRDILKSYGARITMGLHGWRIVRLRDLALIAQGYDVNYVVYIYRGSYTTNGTMTSSICKKTVTGPQSRDTMIGWLGSNQMARYERAYKEARVRFNYEYRNLLKAGDFPDNYLDFWTVSGTGTRRQSGFQRPSRAVSRAQFRNLRDVLLSSSRDAAEHYLEVVGTGSDGLLQTIDDVEVSTNQNLVMSMECMVEYTAALSAVEYQVQVLLIAGPTTADHHYLEGQLGGTPVVKSWVLFASHVNDFRMTVEGGLPSSGQWERFEIRMPDLPDSGELRVTIMVANPTGGAVLTSNFKNVELWGSYDHVPPDKEETRTIEIDTDNIKNPDPTEISLGDIVQSGNESYFFKNAKSTDADGLTITETWRTYRRSGASMIVVGPEQDLVDYLLHGIVTQHGTTRRRLTGKVNLDTSAWAFMIWSETTGGIKYYVPTSYSVDFKRSEAQVSMVELPPIDDVTTPLAVQLVTGWTNGGFGTFAATADLITSLAGTGAETCTTNSISWDANEPFSVRVDWATQSGNQLDITWGVDSESIIANGQERIMRPGTTASSGVLTLTNGAGATAYTNLRITVKKMYGH